MADSDKNVENVEEVKATEETTDTTETEAEVAPEAKEATHVNEPHQENLIEFGGKVAPASEVLEPKDGEETDVNPLDHKEIAKDSPFNPTKGI